MKNRKLRITWSVAWGIAAVLLIAFWVRSYQTAEGIGHINSPESFACVHSEWGTLSYHYQRGTPQTGKLGWTFHTRTASQPYFGFKWKWYTYDPNKPRTFLHYKSPDGMVLESAIDIYLPYWLLVLLTGISSTPFAIPWIPWRYSLRTLLIATTLVAVGLGLIVWLTR